MIGKSKLRRLASLAKYAEISLCIDSIENLQDVSEVAVEMGVNIKVVIEVNVGMYRCVMLLFHLMLS